MFAGHRFNPVSGICAEL